MTGTPFTRQRARRTVILLRYLLPVVTGAVLTVLSFFYLVRYYQSGAAYVQTLFRFYYNTLTAGKAYLGSGSMQAGKNALYGWLSAGAVVGILLYLVGMILAVFSLVVMLRAFHRSEETPTAQRMKLMFKIVFPNRICLFLSNCLFLPVALFPSYFSAVVSRVSGSTRTELLYVDQNIPLTVVLVLTGITLVLALLTAAWEKQEHLCPFLLDRALGATAPAGSDERESGE